MFQRKSLDILSTQKPEAKILFCTGLGVNALPEIPVRLFSYLLPLLAAVRTFQNSRGQFYIADQAALRIGYDPHVVQKNVKVLQKIIRAFINRFYPDITNRISITREKRSDESEDVKEERQALIEQFIHDMLEEQQTSILRFARKRGQDTTLKTALQYMVEHALFMRDPVTHDPRLFLINNPDDFLFETIAMIGGPSEKIFYKVRKILIKKHYAPHQRVDHLQLFTHIGRIPPYYSRFDEPILFDGIGAYHDVEQFLSQIHPELLSDYTVLSYSLSQVPTLTLKIKSKSQLLQDKMDTLQHGFMALQKFVMSFEDKMKSYDVIMRPVQM